MTIFCHHRVNSSADLAKVRFSHGVEVDIRSNGGELLLDHGFSGTGESFSEFLRAFSHEMIILNVKEEGLEMSVLELCMELEVKDFFFLDQSFPNLVRLQHIIGEKSAVRVSDLEVIETSTNLAHSFVPGWIWIDSFLGDWGHLRGTLESSADLGFKTCLASPELHGRSLPEEYTAIARILEDTRLELDAVCSKNLSWWSTICPID